MHHRPNDIAMHHVPCGVLVLMLHPMLMDVLSARFVHHGTNYIAVHEITGRGAMLA